MSISRALVVATLLACVPADPAGAEEYPILFVHGFCSSSATWDGMFDNLPRARFGERLTRLYRAADGQVSAWEFPGVTNLRSFAIDFHHPASGTFDARQVADVSIVEKAGELKAVIDQIKRLAGSSRVIVVSHSMGGLVARSYVQGWGLDAAGRAIAYGHDIARVITIDTPHRGSGLADLPVDVLDSDPFCQAAATVNKAELSPGSLLLNTINNRPWPVGTRLDAIVSYYLQRDTDGFVSREIQDVRTVSGYWATHPDVQAHLQGFQTPPSGLHSAVLRSRVTASRVATLVDQTDRDSVVPFPPTTPTLPSLLTISGTWSGRWASTDGMGSIALTLAQNGTAVTGTVSLGTISSPGTFVGQLTPTSAETASVQWRITYSYLYFGFTCAASFGGSGTVTATQFQGTYSGSDCHHSFSNGTLTAVRSSVSPPVPDPGPASKRFVVSPSELYLSDFAPTGADVFVGITALADRSRVSLTDIAVTPDGTTYGVSLNTLYLVDTTTAILRPIGSGLPSINALASDAAGSLWAASVSDGSLYRIDRNSAAATLVARFGTGWLSSGDLAFDARGMLWATVRRAGETFDTLVMIDLANGSAVQIGTLLPAGLFGLTFVNETLYGLSFSTNSLYVISTADGAATFVRRLAFAPNGTSSIRRD